ncbi:MAG: kinesin [Myxococcales bacterium]|nr:kinesin [Myxococcales bacterium]
MANLVFKKYAGSLQLQIETFDALLAAVDIPKTQWVATAAPSAGLNCDKKFLEFLDTDQNGRIRVAEVCDAIQWTAKMLKDRKGVEKRSDTLVLSSLSKDATVLEQAATLVLEALGKDGATELSLAQIRESAASLRASHFNGDGIVAPEKFSETIGAVAKAVMSLSDEQKNRAEKPGVTQAMVAHFREARVKAREHLAKKKDVYVWGDASESRAATVLAVKARVDEYFLQCRLVATQSDAAGALKPALDGVAGSAEKLVAALSATPIAPAAADGSLTWSKLYRGKDFEALEALRKDAFEPVFSASAAMSEGQWRELVTKSEAIDAWKTTAATDKAIALGDQLERISEDDLRAIEKECAKDLDRKPMIDAVTDLEKLALYQRWLMALANNFIAMPDLYDPSHNALFERGNLVLSGRLFTFSVLVPDRAVHAALSEKGTMYTMYVKVDSAKAGKEPFEVAVPVTAGTSEGIEVGKRGVFTDLEGNEHDATVLQVIRQPVSLWEAMIMPYQKIGRFVSSKIEGFAGEGDKALEKQLSASYATAQTAANTGATAGATAAAAAATQPARPGQPASPATPAAAAAAPQSPGAIAGTVAALGVGVGMIIGAFTSLFTAVSSMQPAQLVGAVIGLVAVVSLPSALFAWLKLRKRDIAIVLEGQGWALNDRILLGKHLGHLFTRKPSRPKGSTSEMIDSVAELVERRKSDGLDESEPEGLQGKHWAAIIAVIIAVGLYQFGGPLMNMIRASRGAAQQAVTAPAATP